MTLISQYNSDGCVGRCDARCYNAKGLQCDCICGGRNHGVGRQKAIENTRQHAEQIVEEHNLQHPEDKVVIESTQPDWESGPELF